MKVKWYKKLYFKFSIIILLLGFLPIAILLVFIFNEMFYNYKQSLEFNYNQATYHISSTITDTIDRYDNITKAIYNYEANSNEFNIEDNQYHNYDKLREVLNSGSSNVEEEIMLFLKNMQNVDSNIYAAHFIAELENGTMISTHFSIYHSFFRSEYDFINAIDYEKLDKTSTDAMLIPTHVPKYYGTSEEVFSIGRNYFDIRGSITERKYVGTLYFDIDTNIFEYIIKDMKFNNNEIVYIFDENNDCYYTNDSSVEAYNVSRSDVYDFYNEKSIIFESEPDEYGLNVLLIMDEKLAMSQVESLYYSLFVFICISILLLVTGAVILSKKFTAPIEKMIKQMDNIGNGNFNSSIEINSDDEIGELAKRFNKMENELEIYINKYYLAQVKQSEAELTALKSQIYPHFLYNTLEIIRMTALEGNSEMCANMIESLAEQIRYVIGPLEDMVLLDKEIEIIKKYVYLINCRSNIDIELDINYKTNDKVLIPKLIIQPIVENAFIHGIKPKGKSGKILLDISSKGEIIEISIIDNGIGMTQKGLDDLNAHLKSDDIGIKDEMYKQSIGLKNVNDRIKYTYGNEYHIKISSKKGIGTVVTVVLPNK